MYDDEMRNNDTAENTTEQTTEQKEDNYYDTGVLTPIMILPKP